MAQLPPELERIILLTYVDSGDVITMRSCALVCGRFCFWAQQRLFHTVYLGFSWVRDTKQQLPLEARLLQRLQDLYLVLKSSPHLSSHIRRIDVTRSFPSLLASLASGEWNSVQSLRLEELPRGSDSNTLESIQRLVAAPQLCTLKLSFACDAWDPISFSHIAASFSPALKVLRLAFCLPPLPDSAGTTRPDSYPPLVPLVSGPTVPKLASLSLDCASAAASVLSEPNFPLDLSQVHEIVYQTSTLDDPAAEHLGFQLLLSRIGHAVYSLEMDSKYTSAKILSFNLPSLTRLRLPLSLGVASILTQIPRQKRLSHLPKSA
uniref:F-box domain-containing protein n=1 Tax=Mycena chlorophos TaxID=658473 RepID=A0ABQ0LJ99_MYCCL|nr:predicted protein [Mycena chlorophos]